MKKDRTLTNFNIAVLAIIIITNLLISVSCTKENKESKFTIGIVIENPLDIKTIDAFKEEMENSGYIENENISYIYEGKAVAFDDLETVITSFIQAKVDLIFVSGKNAGLAAYNGTKESNIPVFFGFIADPVEAGVLTDLTKPGENITGIHFSDNQSRRFNLLLDIVPDIKKIFIPYDSDKSDAISTLIDVKEMATTLGIEIVEGKITNADEITLVMNNIPEDIDAIFIIPDRLIVKNFNTIVTIANDLKIPLSSPSVSHSIEGALIAYGFLHDKIGEQAARIVIQILGGANPGDIPVEIADFYLAINLIIANEIGLDISEDILKQAEIIIRP